MLIVNLINIDFKHYKGLLEACLGTFHYYKIIKVRTNQYLKIIIKENCKFLQSSCNSCDPKENKMIDCKINDYI